MELWRAKINNGDRETRSERRIIVATDNGTILSHVVQTKLDEPIIFDGQPTDWSPVKEIAGKFFMMTGGFTTRGTDNPPAEFLAAIAPFQSEGHVTRIAKTEPGELANVAMAPLITFVNRTWIDTELEKRIVTEFVGRATEKDQFDSHFVVQKISAPKPEGAPPVLAPKLPDDLEPTPDSPLV